MNRNTVENETALNRILGISPQVGRLRKEIKKIAPCDVSVLVTGESGTGKELAVRAIHDLSPRASKPFVAVNCSAIPENLVENELFGHCKGAFTSASLHQEGVVREAEGGILFLDEIGAVDPYIQIKLLRLLQEKEYKPLGDPRARKANIRIVAATNRDLEDLVAENAFREDLYFRLNIVPLYTPPLRERNGDIPLLIEHFLEAYSKEYMKPLKRVTEGAMDMLISYHWPGNIRELENKVQHLVVMVPGQEITQDHLQLTLRLNASMADSSATRSFKTAKRKAIESFEKGYLTRLLTELNGDLVSAAKTAGKSRTAFWNLLSKYHLSPQQFAAIDE